MVDGDMYGDATAGVKLGFERSVKRGAIGAYAFLGAAGCGTAALAGIYLLLLLVGLCTAPVRLSNPTT